VDDGRRDALQQHLQNNAVTTMMNYPLPLYAQEAFKNFTDVEFLPVTERLCKSVISLPMHPELTPEQLTHITEMVRIFFQG
jgi:dTDP-4-amino-4,6-dideoxygalactose transaminase